ncbi:unnamed protein product [Allacma fusca]|uniref:Beta-ketoacyl synthase-like N-terminal domain-containing protein n=1 Tax=Allacma fusca TaxID=39272 RepID=A0A8J2LLD6_9HEXA|nr:unnamed protein product [Allacma fusca]
MESIVIGGMSGRWPKSKSVQEFWNNLVNGVDMIGEVDPKWNAELHGIPTRNGRLTDLDKFDAEFFGVHEKQAGSMDPRLRVYPPLQYIDFGRSTGSEDPVYCYG